MKEFIQQLRRSRWSQYMAAACLLIWGIVLVGDGFRGSTGYAAAGTGSPGDPNISYIGRWDSSSSTVYKSYWGGAYFKTDFTGTTVKIKLAASANIFVSIDNAADVSYPGADGTVNLTPTPLANGVHTLRVASSSQSDVLQFQGLVLDNGASTAPASISSSLIEFIGDSITAGFTDTKVALSDYAWLTAEKLHAEHTQIAYPGICLVDTVTCYSPNAIGMSRQFFKLQTVAYPNSPNWDFSRYQASAVVINLGQNDAVVGVSDATFQSTYITFIQNIRAKYPHAQIFVMRPFSGAKAAPTQAAVNAVRADGDTNVHFIDTTGWLSAGDFGADGVHPTDAGQAKVAGFLAPILSPYIPVSTPVSTPTPASGETVSAWLTTPDQAHLLSPQSHLTFKSVGSNSTTITVNDTQTHQQMVGFGASLTDSSAWLIYNKMSQSQRNQLLARLFSPASGIGLDFLRQPMGASDMALPAGYEGTKAPGEYTYDDVPAGQTDPKLTHFSIAHDQAYIIPLLQQALRLNSNLKIIATPWTAPAWMKSNDSLQQGKLNSSDFQVYAQYFVDFIKAYQAQGIPIYAVTPQNEPENDNVMPTMLMSASDETNFIANYLGPALARNGLTTRILGYDHNWNDPGYPTTILNNATARSYTSGTAWHCYGGDASAMGSFHSAFPTKDIYETECSGGSWEGSNWPNGFQNTMELGINSARNWSKTVMRWNLALDPNGDPNLETANACTSCRGVVTINQATGNVTYNADYYALGQFSKFVLPGAYAVASNSFGAGSIEDAAFKNPDGTDVLVIYNGGSSKTFQVRWNNQAFSYTLPAGAAVTFKWSANTLTTTPKSTPTATATPKSTPTATATPKPTPTATAIATPKPILTSSGSYFSLKNLQSGLVLDDTNGGTASGTPVQQWTPFTGNTNQQWSLLSSGNGYYTLLNQHSGLALADPGGSTANGTPVQLITPTASDASQQWRLVSAGNGYSYLINKASGLALDDTDGSASNGTIMQVWTHFNGNTNQQWTLVAA